MGDLIIFLLCRTFLWSQIISNSVVSNNKRDGEFSDILFPRGMKADKGKLNFYLLMHFQGLDMTKNVLGSHNDKF
jgi:hypothetical protein